MLTPATMPPTNQGQNLINPVMAPLPSSIKGSSAGFYRSIILDVLSIASAFALGYSYHEYLAVGASPLIVLGAFLIFGIIAAVQALLSKSAGRRLFVMLCEAAALGLPFYAFRVSHPYFLLAAVLSFFILFLWGYLESRSVINDSLNFRPFRATERTVSKIVTGLIIFMIVIYIPSWNENDIFISQKSFDVVFDWGAGAINAFYPSVILSGSVWDFASKLARGQLENTASFEQMTFQAQDALVAQNAASIVSAVSKGIGSDVQSTDAVSATVYQFIIKTLIGWKNHFQNIFLIGWGIVLFLAARTIGIALIWVDQFFFLFFYEILLAFRFMRIKEESRTKEVIEY